ncbi:DUF2946 family protein [Defluviimonas sp. SAOS-178_SWC]|uniref:DUF2946 family protein n=1 Tax=Defluviimonas sp. SAOS-178_SWC TaxID=3121287 RepID=UPI003221B29E
MIRQSARSAILALLMIAIGGMSLVAAAARGQTRAGGAAIVLCSGGGLVQFTRDENGQPTGKAHLCPDLAPALLAALDLALPDLTRPEAAPRAIAPDAAVTRATRSTPALRARGPPVPA